MEGDGGANGATGMAAAAMAMKMRMAMTRRADPPTALQVSRSTSPHAPVSPPSRRPLGSKSSAAVYAHRVHVQREMFPREHLWTWSQTSDACGAGGASAAESSSAVDCMLRECAATLAVPPICNSGRDASAVTGSHECAEGIAKRRSPAKKDAQLAVMSPRVVAHNNAPTSTRESEGWRAFKLAHRTNRAISRGRKATGATIAEQGGAGRGNESFASTCVPTAGQEDGGGILMDGPTDEALGIPHELARSEEERLERAQQEEMRRRRQGFLHEVCNDNNDAGDDSNQVRDATTPSSSDSTDSNQGGLTEFWTIFKRAPNAQQQGSPRRRYIERCEKASLLPLPLLGVARQSHRVAQTKTLRLDHYYLGDKRAEALGDALQLMPAALQDLSMKNVGISGAGSAAIVAGSPLSKLQHLNLSENRIGRQGIEAIFNQLQDPRVNLKTLDLGNNQLGDQPVKILLQCLINHCTIEHLDLHRNGIYHSAKLLGELLRISTPLRYLNLSWNSVCGESAQQLIACLTENITLVSLDLSFNAIGNRGCADQELKTLLETNTCLESLNLSGNQIQSKSVLIYVNALQQNSTLKQFIIRDNPIGSLGAEMVVRSLAAGTIPSCLIDIGDCNVEIHESIQQVAIVGGGVYVLNLSDYADVVLLKELLARSWKNEIEIVEASLNGIPFTFNKKDEKTYVNGIPSAGKMQVKTQPNYDRHEDLISETGLSCVLNMMTEAFGSGRDLDEANKLFCIRLLAEEYSFTVDQANALLAVFKSNSSQVEKASAAAALISQIWTNANNGMPEADDVLDCAAMEIPDEFFEDKDNDGKIDACGDICVTMGLQGLSEVEQVQVEKRVGTWISFNVHNPTGRYRLNTSSCLDRRILMRLLEINRGEKKLRQLYKLVDTSQHGSTQQPLEGGFRNVRLNGVPVVMDAAWQFPRLGVLEFDFVMTRRPSIMCTPLSDVAFEKFLKEFKLLQVGAETKLLGLRSISTRYFFSCGQVQRLMEHFGTFERDTHTGCLVRAEVLITLFNRITDERNLSEALSLVDLTTKRQVIDRLGILNLFHPLEATEVFEYVDLALHDHRQLVLILVRLGTSGEVDLLNMVLNKERAVEPDEWKAWSSEDKLPEQGVLSCTMRAVHPGESEAQLPSSSMRKKTLQAMLLRIDNHAQEATT